MFVLLCMIPRSEKANCIRDKHNISAFVSCIVRQYATIDKPALVFVNFKSLNYFKCSPVNIDFLCFCLCGISVLLFYFVFYV